MKNLAMKLVPKALLTRLRAQRDRRIIADWQKVAAGITAPAKREKTGRIIIFPSDLNAITGALGDDAMITATLQVLGEVMPKIAVEMICMSAGAEVVKAKGFNPVVISGATALGPAMAKIFAGAPYDALIVLGADIMDGYYNPKVPIRILIAADIAEKSGVPATILGCSFNQKPAEVLRALYPLMDRQVALNMRDEISLERLRAFVPVEARLVADSAFNLAPGNVDPRATDWAAKMRQSGRKVIGFNVHPMLIKDATEAQVAQIISASVAALKAASAEHEVAWFLMPHDYRGDNGDAVCLKPVHDKLVEAGGIDCHYLDGMHRAADLKAMAGLTDGVITGRMHLAIATLGMGLPVMSLTYQDKFEGLYRHFGLPGKLLLPPAAFSQGDTLDKAVSGFIADLAPLRETVDAALPGVLALARQNYRRYLPGEAE